MSKLLSLSINLSKIDKTKIIEGEKGKYLNLTISIDDNKDQFGNDVSCWHSQEKEEREAKVERLFLGNGRVLWSGESKKTQPKKDGFVTTDDIKDEDPTDLPF